MGRVKRRGVGHEAEGGQAVVVIVLLVLVLVAGGWVAAYAGANGNVPRGTEVAGVDLGGKDQVEAAAALAAGVQSRLAGPMTVQIGPTSTQVTPAEAGLTVDAVETVTQLLRPRSWDPRELWGYYTGGRELRPVVDVDHGAMDALLARLDEQAGELPRNGAVSLAGGQVSVTRPKDGATLDHTQAAAALVDAWSLGRSDVELPLVLTSPDIDQADVDRAVADLANPALSAPVTLTFAGSQVTLSPRDYSDALRFVDTDGTLSLDVDPDALAALVDPAGHDTPASDASVTVTAGAPVVTPAVDGQAYDAAQVAAAFLQAVTAADAGRTVAVTGTAVPAAFTTDQAEGQGVRELVATFAVPLPADPGPGLADAVARLDQTLVQPGQTFSFNTVVGPVDGAGAQLASAVWNAGFLAGLTDVARTAPTALTPGVPEGRDVQVAVGGPDLQLRDDGPHGVLLTARVENGSVVVDAWSTRQYDVTAATGARYGQAARATVASADPACVASPGEDGFSVDLTRTVTPVGDPAAVRTDVVTTTYAPVDAVVCQTP